MTGGRSLQIERSATLAALLLLAAVGWAVLVAQGANSGQPMNGLTMGVGATLFLVTWVVMMVAMMFPAAAPMILMFHRIHAERHRRGQSFVSTWIFVGAYLLVWAGTGVIAYAAAVGAEAVAAGQTDLTGRTAQIGGAVLILAGLYQLSPMKDRCLAKCRSPLSFLLGSWREGTLGAIRMGLEHGAYCLGCCWLLFVILFPLGVMNVAAMAVITALIFAEKTLPWGNRVAQLAAVALVAYGAVVIAVPRALPTYMDGMTDRGMPTMSPAGGAETPGGTMPGM